MTMRSKSDENYVRVLDEFEKNIGHRILSCNSYGNEIKAVVKVIS